MKKYIEIEKTITKEFKKNIWIHFTKAVREYNLINEGDKIAVCISGGKDSILLAKCMEEIKKHRRVNFELEFIVMDPGYNNFNRKLIEENLKLLNIPAKIFETPIFEIVNNIKETPCYLCAKMRRGYLYNEAKNLGCNKIALGHHFDDVIETNLLNIFYGGEIKTMMPKLHSKNFSNMELIRPLYLVKEKEIINWVNYNNLTFLNCACKFTENISTNEKHSSKRQEMKDLITHFRKVNSTIDSNIFRSMENINLNNVVAYKKNNIKNNFLDDY